VAWLTRLRICVEEITDATRTSYLGCRSAMMDSCGPIRGDLVGSGSCERRFLGAFDASSVASVASVASLRFFEFLPPVVVDIVAVSEVCLGGMLDVKKVPWKSVVQTIRWRAPPFPSTDNIHPSAHTDVSLCPFGYV